MQQMSSQENSDPQEIDRLGEHYHLGAVQGAYYVTYTQADINRYRYNMIFIIIMSLLLSIYIVSGVLSIFNLSPAPVTFFPLILLSSILLANARRRWGNWPIINPENREQRVYLYENGLIKLTAKHCDVVSWSQMRSVVYTLPMVGNKAGVLNTQVAGIQVSRHGARKLILSGALGDFEDLVRRIKRACDQISHATVHTDKLPMDRENV